ncbi:MAG TPA: porin [Planctomycetaceae bacterium]|nr:porin [Planctomycetaceae bacterium]
MNLLRLMWIGTASLSIASLHCHQSDAQVAEPTEVIEEVDEFTSEDNNARIQALEAYTQKLDAELKKLEVGKRTEAVADAKFPKILLSGVFQADTVLFSQNDASREAYGGIANGTDFRRARLGAKGSVATNMDYFMQMDFAFFGRPTFTDVWVDFKEAGPLGTVRVGQWKQPFSLEVASSFRYTTFMERAGTFQAFTPFRHLGIGFYNHSEDLRWTWAASYFRTGQDQFGGSLSAKSGNGVAARLTHLLWDDEHSGSDYLHVGAAYFLNAPPNEKTRFRSIPEIYVGEFVVPPGEPIGTSGQPVPNVADGTPFFVDTGLLTGVSLAQAFGTESLWVRGPFSWQTEMIGTFVDTSSVGDGFLWGGYTQVGYFLTGEHRPYDRKAGAIDRVIPKSSLCKNCSGYGAWEIASRCSYLDLSDQAIEGGEMLNLTTGLNWYVNPYCKCVFNHIHSWTQARPTRNGTIIGNQLLAAQTDAYAMRVQIDF